MIKLLNKLAFLMLVTTTVSAQGLVLTEEFLQDKAKQGSPSLDQIEAAFQSVAISKGEEREKYAPELFGQGSYSETNERALIAFAPVFTPVKQAQVGVRQNFANGFDTSATLTTDQRSARGAFIGQLQNGTTTTLAFTMQMDLWKNLLGRMSKAKLESLQLETKKAELEKEIQTKSFKISLRRLYWSLVTNQQALLTSEELLKTAVAQANETKLRFKNSVAEADEVARYNAQVASREGTITFLKYRRETYLTQLKNLLPELSGHELQLGAYDLNKTIDQILACTEIIASEKKTPFQFTKYDEIVTMLRQIKSNSAVYNSRYSDMDVKLFSTIKATGVSLDEVGTNHTRGTYGESFRGMTDQNRSGYEVGLKFSVPLDSTKSQTKKSKEIYDERRLLASINATDLRVINTHNEFIRTIKLLQNVIVSQKISAQELNKRLKGMRRKYEQARVSVNDLVLDQDALLNAELNTIETQLQILNTFFDYLVIFTDTPCEFNRI